MSSDGRIDGNTVSWVHEPIEEIMLDDIKIEDAAVAGASADEGASERGRQFETPANEADCDEAASAASEGDVDDGTYVLCTPITSAMLAEHAAQKEGHDMGYYSSSERYSDDRTRRRQRRYRKVILVILALLLIACIGAVAYLASMFATASSAEATRSSDMHQQNWRASETDIEILAAEGYDAIALTDDVEGFCTAFFTFDKDSVKDGSWMKSFESYTAPSDQLVAIQENLIYVREKEDWQKVFDVHPYFSSKIVSCNRISWSILPTQTVNVPYCDAYIEVDRCPITRYVLNSPDFVINRYLDRYRIVFDESGKITSCKRMNSVVLDEDVDEEAVAADAAVYDKAIADAKRKAEEVRRQEAEAKARADAEAKAKAEAEAKAEEEAKKQAEKDYDYTYPDGSYTRPGDAGNSNANTNTGSESGGNSNSNSNTGDGGSSGNSNTNAGGEGDGSGQGSPSSQSMAGE